MLRQKLILETTIAISLNTVPPQVKVSPSTQFHTSGVTVKLKCHADGIPEPEIMWEKNEAPLPEQQDAGHYIRLCKYLCAICEKLLSIQLQWNLFEPHPYVFDKNVL